MSRLTKITLLLGFFFAFDKCIALLRQVIIARQFGLSPELDAFNVANNVPDLLFALISGGALAVAFIPVLTETLTREGRSSLWDLFARVANIAFIVTVLLALLVGLFSRRMVGWQFGIAPGFEGSQQLLVVNLMRLNLAATLIFSISGLVMAGLQANQHFLLPAAAPIFYNFGQIFGAIFLAPDKGYVIKGITLPAMGLGVYGLVYGVIIGALLHLAIQVPGLIKYKFHWIPSLGIDNPAVRKVLMMMGPRVVNILFVQIVFIVRDNLASRLQSGAVSALTYGWMIQQVPETLIGTAIGTALLPTLSELVAREEKDQFKEKIERAIKTLIAITLPVAIILAIGLQPFIAVVFKFNDAQTDLMMWVTRGYLVGLAGHCILEVGARSFFARQNAVIPLIGSALNVLIYITAGSLIFRPLGAAGVSLTDSIAFTAQAVFVLFLLNRRVPSPFSFSNTTIRAVAAAIVGGGLMIAVQYFIGSNVNPLVPGILSMAVGLIFATPFIWKEVRLLVKL